MFTTHTERTTRVVLGMLITAFALTVLISLPSRSQAADEGTVASSTTTKVRKAKVDATCMQAAVETRDAAIGTAWGTFGTSVTSALTARTTALVSAWGLSDVASRNTALKTAWTDWKNASKKAHADLKSTRKAAWDAFRNTAKTSCKITTPKDEALGKDASGSISL